LTDTAQRAVEGTYSILYLPHIQEVFGNVLFSKFLRYKHLYNFSIVNLQITSEPAKQIGRCS
jgi:hypothetical protein